MGAERRQLTRYNVRTPLRFRAINLMADHGEHFTEALNVSRGGFFFASSAPLQIGMPIEATLRMPAEITASKASGRGYMWEARTNTPSDFTRGWAFKKFGRYDCIRSVENHRPRG